MKNFVLTSYLDFWCKYKSMSSFYPNILQWIPVGDLSLGSMTPEYFTLLDHYTLQSPHLSRTPVTLCKENWHKRMHSPGHGFALLPANSTWWCLCLLWWLEVQNRLLGAQRFLGQRPTPLSTCLGESYDPFLWGFGPHPGHFPSNLVFWGWEKTLKLTVAFPLSKFTILSFLVNNFIILFSNINWNQVYIQSFSWPPPPPLNLDKANTTITSSYIDLLPNFGAISFCSSLKWMHTSQPLHGSDCRKNK